MTRSLSAERPARASAEPGDTRERILQISTELFVRNGYHATGIQELSDAVGVGRGALYHHIGSKEQLLFTISIALLQPVTDAAAEIASSEAKAEEKLRALARALLRNHAEHRGGWTVAIGEARSLTPEHRAEVVAARNRYEAIWAGVIEQGAAEGVWRRMTAIELRGVLGMLNSTARWMRDEGAMTPDAIADVYIDLVIAGIASGRR